MLQVVLALVVVATLALLLNLEGPMTVEHVAAEAQATQVDYLTHAGVAHAEWQVQDDECGGDVGISTTPLSSGSYTATATGMGTTTSYNLTVDQDAWIRSDDVTKNNGTGIDQHIRFETGKVEQALYRFDLSSLPAGAQINSASAWFYVEAGKEHPEGPITVHRVNEDWTETGATWDTMNGNFDATILATIPAQAQSAVWVQVNLTAQVQAWVNGDANFGILFSSTSEGVHGEYVSRDGVAGQQPYLEVVVGSASIATATIQADGTLANGVTRSVTRTDVSAYQPTSYRVMQPGPILAKDAYTWEANKSTNYGTDDETWVAKGSNNDALALFEFDVGATPPGAKVVDATLSVYHRNGNDPDVPITAHRITQYWDEDFVTWNDRDNGTAWNNPGGDFDSIAIETTDVGPTSAIRYEWNITSLVQGWVDGTYPNYGVVLRTEAPGIFGERFDTSDHADETRHPRLSLSYRCACDVACLAPQASGNLLMVVGNPSSLKPHDIVAQESFESWGYTVTLIQDSDPQASFDTAVAANDVVYISPSAQSGNADTKLTAAPIGVVTAKPALNDELGIASGSNKPIVDTLTVVDVTHDITRIFPAGALRFKTAASNSLIVDGAVAAGAQALAQIGGIDTIVTIDTGGALYGGGTATGRRVLAPVSSDDYDWFLNNNGRLIVQRALEWARDPAAVLVPGLWLSTATDVTASGAPGLDAWTNGEALEVADPNFALEPGTTNGTFTSMFNLDGFAGGNATIDAIHYVNADITVGSANTVDLYAGDVLLSTSANETLTSTNSLAVEDEDVFIFRTDTADDYSAGTFLPLIEDGDLHDEGTVGVSLVEKDTTVGDRFLAKGSFLMAITSQRDVMEFDPEDVGPTSTGSFAELIDGPSLSLGSEIRGLDLAEEETTIGGQVVPAGSILLTLNNDDPGGVGDNLVPADSADIFYLTVTTVGASPVADATLLFEGADVNLDTSSEHLQSLTMVRTVPGPTVDKIILSTDSNATLGGLSFTDNDLAKYDPAADTATLYLDGVAAGLTKDITALHVLANGHLVLAAKGNPDATLGGVTFQAGDLVDYDPVADSATLIFDGNTLFTDPLEKISSVHVLDNGHFVLSTDDDAILGGLSFTDIDLVEYDPLTDTASLFFDGSLTTLNQDIVAVHVLADGHIVLSCKANATLGGLSFGDGDLVDFDPVADSATLYFDGSLFTLSESIRSAHIGRGTGIIADPNAPFAHWKLDETSGTQAIDSVGSNDGTFVDTPAWVTGQVDGGLDFDGVDDYVDVGTFDVAGTGLTMLGWFNAESIPTSDPRIVSKADGPDEGDAWWQISTTDSGSNRYLRMRVKAGGTTTTFADSTENLTAGNWYFAVATYDNASGDMKLYLDGAEIASGSHAFGGAVDTGPAVPVAIGANGTAERFFDGVLDDVRVYDRALDATEISALFAAGGGDSCTAHFADDFESGGYSGGTGAWTSDWTEFNDDGNPGGQDEQNKGWAGTQVLQVKDNNGGGEGVWRDLDLAGYTSATLSLTYWRSSLENSNDWAALEYSTNGGGAWTEVARVEGPGTDAAGSPQTLTGVDMESATGGNARFRVLTAPNMGGNDRVYFDDIDICAD